MTAEHIGGLVLQIANCGPELHAAPPCSSLPHGGLPPGRVVYTEFAHEELQNVFKAWPKAFAANWEM